MQQTGVLLPSGIFCEYKNCGFNYLWLFPFQFWKNSRLWKCWNLTMWWWINLILTNPCIPVPLAPRRNGWIYAFTKGFQGFLETVNVCTGQQSHRGHHCAPTHGDRKKCMISQRFPMDWALIPRLCTQCIPGTLFLAPQPGSRKPWFTNVFQGFLETVSIPCLEASQFFLVMRETIVFIRFLQHSIAKRAP